jgi:hypothetical protein
MQYRFSILLTATEKSDNISDLAIHVIASPQEGAAVNLTFLMQ